jgi:ferredoxin
VEERAMRAFVDHDTCTRCGVCASACPAVFEMGDDAANVIVAIVPREEEAACREAMASCPVDSISIRG